MAKSLDFAKDLQLLKQYNADFIIGIDEVGRGCWAGPVCVGAYVLDVKTSPFLEGVNDSKLVKKEKREELSLNLGLAKHMVLTGQVESINSIGIGKTISTLISKAVNTLNKYAIQHGKRAVFIIDGQFKVDFGVNTIKQNKADTNYYSVAAASILAKVYRDNLMNTLHTSYNHYGFNKNKGYPTPEHLKALEIYGVTPIHRTSFKPISNQLKLLNENN